MAFMGGWELDEAERRDLGDDTPVPGTEDERVYRSERGQTQLHGSQEFPKVIGETKAREGR